MGYLFEAIGSLKGIMTRDKTEMRSGTVRKCACKPTHGEIGLICAIRRGRNVFEISGTAGRWKSTICDQVDTAGRSKSVHLPTVSDIQIHFNLFWSLRSRLLCVRVCRHVYWPIKINTTIKTASGTVRMAGSRRSWKATGQRPHILWVLIEDRTSRFPLWRHQLRASAARRAAWSWKATGRRLHEVTAFTAIIVVADSSSASSGSSFTLPISHSIDDKLLHTTISDWSLCTQATRSRVVYGLGLPMGCVGLGLLYQKY